MPFLTPLTVQEVPRAEWRLVVALEYAGARDAFTVPVGFDTDFASVPRMFWSTFPPYGRHTKAAVLHDYLYACQPLVGPRTDGAVEPDVRQLRRITRKEADGLFRRVMKELGVSMWRRNIMYRAVRFGGGRVWRRAARKLAAK